MTELEEMTREVIVAVKAFNVLQCDGCRDIFWWNETTNPIQLAEIAIQHGWKTIPHRPFHQEHIMCPKCGPTEGKA